MQMRAGTRERVTGACDTLIAIAAVLIIVAAHWPWANATITPPTPDVMQSPGQATGLYAHASLWAATGIAVVQLALLVARYFLVDTAGTPRRHHPGHDDQLRRTSRSGSRPHIVDLRHRVTRATRDTPLPP